MVTADITAATGAYTVTQNTPIVHAAGLDENDQAFTLNYRVTDGDGDTTDGTLDINVENDVPVHRERRRRRSCRRMTFRSRTAIFPTASRGRRPADR